MARQLYLLLTIVLAGGCGGSVADHPSPLVLDEATGTLKGMVTVQLGRDVHDVTIQPVATTVMLFPIQQITQNSAGVLSARGAPVAVTASNAVGDYSMHAPQGLYTLLVSYEGLSEPSLTDPRGWNPVEVQVNHVTEADVLVNRNHGF